MSRHLVLPLFLVVLAAAAARAPGQDAPPPAQVKKPGAIFRVPDSYTFAVALSADGKLLARAGINKVDLWDVASRKELHTLKGHSERLFKLAFSPDGKTLASATGHWGDPGGAGEVKLWDVATGKEGAPVKGHPTPVFSNLAFSADGKTLATSGGTVKLWDVATGKEKMELGDGAWSLAFSPDGKTLAMGVGGFMAENAAKPGSVQLWDLTTGKKRASMPGHQNGDLSIGFTPDGKTLVTAGDGELKLWDVATAKERATIVIPGDSPPQFFPLAFTADSNTLIAAIWSVHEKEKEGGLSVQHWDLATGKAGATLWAPINPGSNNAGIFFAALSADGKTVAWGGEEKHPKYMGTAYVLDVQSLATSPPKLPVEPKKPD